MTRWLLESPRRFTTAAVIGGALILLMIVFTTSRTISHLPHARPTAVASGAPGAPAYVPQAGGSDPTFTFVQAGSAVPSALKVASAWIAGRPSVALMDPGAYEAAIASPADNVAIDGTATTSEGGPTEQDVVVPTNSGNLLVVMSLEDGHWTCSAFSWATT
jgi:hypothetical protein